MKTNFANKVVKAAKRAAFLLSLVLVAVISFSCIVFIFGPVLELTVNVECNALAVVDRIFPRFFPCRMPFQCFSFWHRMLHA